MTFAVLVLAGCGKVAPIDATRGGSEHFEFLLANSAADYLKIGKKSPTWDRSILRAFTNYAEVRSGLNGTNSSSYWRSDFNRAIESGCDDALVKAYALRVDGGLGRRAHREEQMKAWTNAAGALEKTGYSAYQKFYMNLCAVNALRAATGTNSYWEVAYFYDLALTHMETVLANRDTPAEELMRVVTEFLESLKWSNNGRSQILDRAEPMVKQRLGNSWHGLHLKGVMEAERAWLARGGKSARQTTQEQWDGYYKHAGVAEKAFAKAWKKQPRVETAIEMIRLQLCYSNTRDRMEYWFEEAMRLRTNSYDAAYAKYHYLKPIWHGTRRDQHSFARECVGSTNWGGNVPLIMIDYHNDVASGFRDKEEYYARMSVWSEIDEALTKFFKLNPDAEGWHHDYFWYAYVAKDWDIAKRELEAMNNDINYDFFGGEDEFRKMEKEVRDKAWRAVPREGGN